MEDLAKAKGLVKCGTVPVVTPGTALEPDMLQETSNNYLVALDEHDGGLNLRCSSHSAPCQGDSIFFPALETNNATIGMIGIGTAMVKLAGTKTGTR